MTGKVFFITAIDTGCGKSFVTGSLARYLLKKNISAITQKLVQTGCSGLSEDIVLHRQIMGVPLFAEDVQGITCPYVFEYPASPHLSARLSQTEILRDTLTQATRTLRAKHSVVLLEGVGGLMVPLSREMTLLDYVAGERYPVLLVTSGRLGSINHTLLSLRACRSAGLDVAALVFNRYPESDPLIAADSLEYFRHILADGYPGAVCVDFPQVDLIHGERDGASEHCWDEFYQRSCSR